MRKSMIGLLGAILVLTGGGIATATDVFNMGGTRDPVTGTWTGLASLEMVHVGNPGNAADIRVMDDGTSGYGSVGYNYNIGKFDVTAAQYTEFLNAVAKTDTYGLYRDLMDYDTYSFYEGCNIKRSGPAGSYTYSVPANWANRPVNYVSWGDAARFCNWLTNGQPTGTQGPNTTEGGSYYLNGATSNADLMAVTRKTVAQGGRYYIPTEDEWYKAAYYDPSKAGGAGYWLYPTRTNDTPSHVLSPTGTNNANFYASGYTIGSPYYRTDVGAFAGSPSALGTFDQGGNTWQWNEANISGSNRGTRGGSFSYNGADTLQASYRSFCRTPMDEYHMYSFRVSEVPEPATLSLLALGGAAVIARRRRKVRTRC